MHILQWSISLSNLNPALIMLVSERNECWKLLLFDDFDFDVLCSGKSRVTYNTENIVIGLAAINVHNWQQWQDLSSIELSFIFVCRF